MNEPKSVLKLGRSLTKPPTRVYFGYVNLTLLPPVNSVMMLVLGRPLG